MKINLLQSKDKQIWLVNCQITGNRLFVGYGYIGYVSEQEQILFNISGKNTVKVIIPEDVLYQYGCSQFNFYLDCVKSDIQNYEARRNE